MKTFWFSDPEEFQAGIICWQDFFFMARRNHDRLEKVKLRQLQKAIKKCKGKLREATKLLQDNALVHTAHFAVAESAKCGFELLHHRP